jgi:protease II
MHNFQLLTYFEHLAITTENFFDYIMSYSPIDNVKHGVIYPSCLITGGLHDPRVQVSSLPTSLVCRNFYLRINY